MNLRRMFFAVALLVATPVLFAQAPAARSTAKPIPVNRTAAANRTSAASAGQATLIDINTASPDQLMTLPGIGDAYAKRIVGGRPYTAKNQLSTRGILPNGTYEKIAGQIIAKRSSK